MSGSLATAARANSGGGGNTASSCQSFPISVCVDAVDGSVALMPPPPSLSSRVFRGVRRAGSGVLPPSGCRVGSGRDGLGGGDRGQARREPGQHVVPDARAFLRLLVMDLVVEARIFSQGVVAVVRQHAVDGCGDGGAADPVSAGNEPEGGPCDVRYLTPRPEHRMLGREEPAQSSKG